MGEVTADLHHKVLGMEGLGVALVQVLACLVHMVTGIETGHHTGGDSMGSGTDPGLDHRMTRQDGVIQIPVRSLSAVVSTRQIEVGIARLHHLLMVVVVSPQVVPGAHLQVVCSQLANMLDFASQ